MQGNVNQNSIEISNGKAITKNTKFYLKLSKREKLFSISAKKKHILQLLTSALLCTVTVKKRMFQHITKKGSRHLTTVR